MHLGTKFGLNAINRQGVIIEYSQKITPICCHGYRINRLWEEAENWWVNKVTTDPQTFCSLKEIKLQTMKIQQKDQQCVAIMKSKLANKKQLLATLTRKTAWSNALKITI